MNGALACDKTANVKREQTISDPEQNICVQEHARSMSRPGGSALLSATRIALFWRRPSVTVLHAPRVCLVRGAKLARWSSRGLLPSRS